MISHQVDIYHCQRCGKVVSRAHVDGPPNCCHETMALAVANVTYQDDSEKAGSVDEVIEKSHGSEQK